MSKAIWILVTTLIGLNIVTTSTSKCANLNVSLTQKIDGEGFHRDINWLLERNASSSECKLVIKLDVGQEMFINPDQIADLNRLNHLSILIVGEVDVEMPAHLATEHTVYVFVPSEQKVSISVPFHLRYQRAQISGGIGKIVLNKPSILSICDQKCGNKVKAPCDVSSKNQCEWNNVTYQALFGEVELFVPVGDLDDYPLVSVVTLLLGCAGCIYTLSVLSTTPL